MYSLYFNNSSSDSFCSKEKPIDGLSKLSFSKIACFMVQFNGDLDSHTAINEDNL